MDFSGGLDNLLLWIHEAIRYSIIIWPQLNTFKLFYAITTAFANYIFLIFNRV